MMLGKKSSTAGAPPGTTGTSQRDAKKKKMSLEDFISSRDYTGAISLLEFNKQMGQLDEKYPTLPWLAYSAFHLGDYQKAANVFKEMMSSQGKDVNPMVPVYLGCCYYYLGDYSGALKAVEKCPESPLKLRLLFHVSHKQNDENALMTFHQKLQNTVEDQLSLAAIHYLRSHYQEATEIYKKLLLENREFLALNVYIALCYYRLDYYDVSLEVLQPFLQQFPDSAVALNLKACNHYRLYNGQAAEQQLKQLLDLESEAYAYQNELVQHNLVVFRGGTNALNVLPKLVPLIPEARLNLAIYYLKQGEDQEAFDLLKELEPVTPQEYILKGIVNALVGQRLDSASHVKMAQQYFQIVGSSASECDTIPGRQSMASCFFLLKQFEDVLVYLRSIKSYFYTENDFNWNLGLALVATGNHKEAEEVLGQVASDAYRADFCYVSHIARAKIANGNPKDAWDFYLRMESSAGSNSGDAFQLLQLIANDCYRHKHYLYAAKAFDVLERLDPAPEYWEGKRGAICGVFQSIVTAVGQKSTSGKHEKQCKEQFREILQLMQSTKQPQAEKILRVMQQWAREAHFKV